MFACQVINYANNQDRAKQVLDELQNIPNVTSSSKSPRFESLRADVGDRSAIQRLVQETVSKFGRLDVVVSNAGWTRITNFMNLEEGMNEDDWDMCFRYNVKAHLWLFHAAKTELEKTEGAFITTASLAGVKPGGSSLPYSVTKSAAIHLSKGLAVIAGPHIRVNTVSPGLLLTEWGMKFPEEKRAAAKEAAKLKRVPTVEVCIPIRTLSMQLMILSGLRRCSANASGEQIDDRTEFGRR